MKLVLKVFCLVVALSAVQADHWAVLVAGSNGYGNYRHQADICHAYQIVRRNGIPASNIITLAYDDIAHNYENPFPGKMFNKPTKSGVPGVDVYAGCKIDYKGEDVTPDNFIKILEGKKTSGGNGKTLKSTKSDHVFINFADHGGVGLIAFPSSYLYADTLIKALKYMHDNEMYQELVFYLESCESGSMFENLPDNIEIVASTAANAEESSWGTYCPPDDMIDGKSINSCLGDLYSINWMEDSDKADMDTETLLKQFLKVKELTTKSHVSDFGDLSFDNEPLIDFQGDGDGDRLPFIRTPRKRPSTKLHAYVDSRDIQLHYLMNKYQKNPTIENFYQMKEEEQSRQYFDTKFEHLATSLGADESQLEEVLTTYVPVIDYDCERAAINRFEDKCEKLTDYSLKYVRFLVTVCESGITTDEFMGIIDRVCE